jgi:biotin/methionine sulfoxide reductase
VTGDPSATTKVTSSHWGAFEVDVADGRMIVTRPFSGDPDPSRIPDILPAAVHHKTRVLRPSIRRGWLDKTQGSRRGSDDFVELPWDEALDIAAHEIDRVRREHGNEAIFGGSYGWASAGRFHHAQSQVHRFLNCIGGYVASFGSYSTGCAQSIMPHVFGVDFLTMLYEHQDGWPTIHDHTETLVMFGGINAKNAQVSMGGITEHETRGWFARFAEKGMRCVNIGPQRSDAPESCAWMPVRPGSDTALMLALAYVLEEEGLANRDFLDSHTVGYERFRPYLMGEVDGVPKSPDWAGPICGAAPEDDPRPCAPHGHDPHAHHRRLVAAAGRTWRTTLLDVRRPRRDAGADRSSGRRRGLWLRRDRRRGKVADGPARHDILATDEPGEDDHPGGADRRHAAQSRAGPTISTESGGPIPISA